ncbi:class Ib ribonucleoside-diphosphate reductase assembly flavoprotein NrdI [Hutsoniella sourekii]|uniref:class Ib ribonucleoside-diphosphate reductase assembly flavoprotein NrdI n=1 Tax=Hutsoniella sourekii TaxID=87650 RepID=UPI000489347A|nr:class Ib ribonucleoside-diphosphate reductase assembly flavoprotein NrdI [Hutsoniella sourekii]
MIVFFSLTGQTRRFVKKLACDQTIELKSGEEIPKMTQPYLLIVPTYVEEVVEVVFDFLDHGDNASYCKGVCGSGNRNFAQLFCFTAKDIAEDYHIPLLHMFEFQGSENDVAKVEEELKKLA